MPIYLSVVIPAFDEIDQIADSIRRVTTYVGQLGRDWELIVVLDGGSADMARAATAAAAGQPQIRILDNGQNHGKGFSVRRGIFAATGRFVLFADADLSLPIEGSGPFLEALENGADLAIGSRSLPQSEVRGMQPRLRSTMSQAFNWVVRLTILKDVRDSQCGFKAFRAEVARDLFSRQRLDRFGFDVEILWLAQQRRYHIVELPVACVYHHSSSVRRVYDAAGMTADLLRIRWNALLGRYDRAS